MAKQVSDYKRARMLLEIYRGEADDFFKLWPQDKQFYFSSDNRAFIAYGVNGKVAVCIGDPVGASRSIQKLLEDFVIHCAARKLRIAFVQTTNKYREQYSAAGFRSVLIGADAAINLDRFAKTTIHNKYFRNLVNRYDKSHFMFEVHGPPHHTKLLKELRDVSNSWLKLPNRKEWSFLTGKFDDEYLQQANVYAVRDSSGDLQAFANELPSFKPGVITIDLMRHRMDAPPNSIDFLFIKLLLAKHEEGYESFNLGMSPLDGKPFATGLAARLIIYVYQVSNRFIGFKGLHQFKAKYDPEWEPRYVWYQDGKLNLIPVGLAVLRLLKGS